MKKIIVSLIAITFTFQGFSQMTFSVSPNTGFAIPGLSHANALFGYKSKNINPYIGLSIFNGGVNQNIEYDFGDDYELNGTLRVITPTLGIKYFIPIDDVIKPYINFSILLPLVSGNIDDDNGNDELLEDTKVFLVGSKFGFGAEYYFSSSFSLGGEFGINHYRLTYEYNGNNSDEITKVNATPSYTKISLNYYFGKSKKEDI